MKKLLSRLYMGLMFLFLYAPIAVVIVFSFNTTKSRTVMQGFTFQWYAELFSDSVIIRSLVNSIEIAVISSVVATVFGTIAAVYISKLGKHIRSVVMNVTYIPVINPDIVTGVSLMLFFALIVNAIQLVFGVRPSLGFWSVLIAHITFNVPYVILNVLPKLRQTDKNLFDAAQDLGCNPKQAFFKAVLPEIMPGVASGFLMAFSLSLDDFIISYFTSGSGFQTLPVTIYSLIRRRVTPKINALFALIFVLVFVLLLVMNLRDTRMEKKKGKEMAY